MDSSFAASEPGHTRGNARSSGANSKAKSKSSPPPFLLPLNVVFTLLLISHLLSAATAPIADCDETYNYWEPLHYLVHNYGLQTWEYSPTYAIRSWAYILLHALPTKLFSFLTSNKAYEFYFLRSLLAFVAAAAETRLYSAISRTLHGRIAVFYVVICAFTPGFWAASTALLPSSFAMYTSTLGLSCFLDISQPGGLRTARGIMWFGIGALLGWPFAGALIVPFVLEDWARAWFAGRGYGGLLRKYADGVMRCVTVLVVQCAIDASFYRKLVIVPWSIVAYNVFGGGDRGPDIFGTEPWHFYVRNLAINFNLWFALALAAGPLMLVQALFLRQKTNGPTLVRTAVLLTPFYLWFAIFTVQPHKEERFIFPAYSFLALNASIAMHMLLTWAGDQSPSTFIGKIPAQVKLAFILPVVAGSVVIGLLRIAGVTTAYGAPIKVLEAFQQDGVHWNSTDSVCYGKEWYRHPSTFLLSGQMHTKFIKSEFAGLLPGEFDEGRSRTGLGWFPGTWLVPSGMNDRNEEDFGKYIDVNRCDWLVDSAMHDQTGSTLEPLFVKDASHWEKVRCEKFLDVGHTGTVARLLWTPDSGLLPRSLRRQWGEYCLLQRRKN